MLNEGKSCADKAGREINCTLKIDVSDTINTCGYRALELARHYCATAEAYRREGRWWFAYLDNDQLHKLVAALQIAANRKKKKTEE